jgi:hypothetical protein
MARAQTGDWWKRLRVGRLYWPKQEAVDGQWKPPAIARQ